MDLNKSNIFIHFLQKGLFATDYSYRSGHNFCDMCRNVAGAVLLSFILFYVAGWFLVFGIAPWLLYFFVDGYLNPFYTDLASVGLNLHVAPNLFAIILVVVIALIIVALVDNKFKEWQYSRRDRKKTPKPKHYKTPWYREAYQGFKDKYCPLVHIIDDSKED